MNDPLRQWLDSEMRSYEPVFRSFNRRLMKRVPLWMALSVIALVALGFGVGYDWQYVVRVHLLIGIGIAVFIWLCFWIQTRSVSMKKVRQQYEQALSALSPSDQDAFARQAPCGSVDFLNSVSDKYPARLTVGPDYWLYFRGGCRIFRAADMEKLWVKEETSRIGYDIGKTHVRQNVGMGISLMVDYRDGTAWAANDSQAKVYMENMKQMGEAQALIEKYCPKVNALWDKD